ncbi:ras GEF [Gonapodya prolifera JEL478]|uniref:Ras GEF n=1 Tax=Gonapodya prolifera (strain JEL478) TaxID=1344416 RepID=A0A139A3U8_GONPJ|nr:ras GEF [Gonapodya prolifera JEL478]|eukprot:KXS11043.1 ras GEF [Gonapodya prolifera JEL478]
MGTKSFQVNTIYGRSFGLFNGGVQVPLTSTGCAILEAGGTYTAENIHSEVQSQQQTSAVANSQSGLKGSKMQLKKLSRDASESATLKRMGSEFTSRMKTLSKLALSVDPSATRSLDVMNQKNSGDAAATAKSQTLNLMDTVRQKSKRPTASGAILTDSAIGDTSHGDLPVAGQNAPAKFMSVDRLVDTFTGTIRARGSSIRLSNAPQPLSPLSPSQHTRTPSTASNSPMFDGDQPVHSVPDLRSPTSAGGAASTSRRGTGLADPGMGSAPQGLSDSASKEQDMVDHLGERSPASPITAVFSPETSGESDGSPGSNTTASRPSPLSHIHNTSQPTSNHNITTAPPIRETSQSRLSPTPWEDEPGPENNSPRATTSITVTSSHSRRESTSSSHYNIPVGSASPSHAALPRWSMDGDTDSIRAPSISRISVPIPTVDDCANKYVSSGSTPRTFGIFGKVTTAEILASVDKVSGPASISGIDLTGQRQEGKVWCVLEDYVMKFHQTEESESQVAFSFPIECIDFTRETFSMEAFAFELKHHKGTLSILVATKETLIQWIGSINTSVNNILLAFGLAGIQRKFEETSGDPNELFPVEFNRILAKMQNQDQSWKRRSQGPHIDEEGLGDASESESQPCPGEKDDPDEDKVIGSLIRQTSTNFLNGGEAIRYQRGPDGVENTSVIIAATVDKLIERLAGERLDSEFVDNFLLCYRHFTDAPTVLSKLIQRMCVQPPPGATKDQTDYVRHWRALVKLRAATVVAKWIEGFWADFLLPVSSRRLTRFIERLAECNSTDEQDRRQELKFKVDFEQVVEVLKATMNAAEKGHRRRMQAAGKVTEVQRRHGLPEFIDMEPKEVALRLTILEHEKFRRVRPVEFVLQIWGDSKDPTLTLETKNIREMIDSFNHVSYWAATEIVTQPELKNRLKVVEKLIKIAKELRRLNNFNSLLAIVSGLNNSCVSRLKSTWEALSSKATETRAELERLVNPEGNFGVYRALYAAFQCGEGDSQGSSSTAMKPFIPIFSLIMKDFLFVNDGNPRYLDESGASPLVNWAKLTMIADAVRTIERLQRTPYTFPDAFSTDMPQNYYQTLSDKVLYKYSQLCEARAGDVSTTRLVDKWRNET